MAVGIRGVLEGARDVLEVDIAVCVWFAGWEVRSGSMPVLWYLCPFAVVAVSCSACREEHLY